MRRVSSNTMRAAVKVVAKSLTTTLIVFLLAETALRGAYLVRNSMVRYVPLPFTFGDDYGPLPPWLDALLIIRSDETLIWKHEANVHRTYLDLFEPVRTPEDRIALLRRFRPSVPREFRSNATWDVRLNSDGHRGAEFSSVREPATVRIAAVGDSWTFGMPVGEEETYPSRLAAWLGQERPDTEYEVLNFGVLGYSSFQGLQLMKARVLDFDPHVVVIGFGMNDSDVAGYRDRDIVSLTGGRRSLLARVREVGRSLPGRLEGYKLLKYAALVSRFRPKPIGEHLKKAAETRGSGPVDYDALEQWTRVSPRDFESNIREMTQLAREHGARVVLVDNELWADSPYRAVLMRLAYDLDVPFVDSLSIVTGLRREIEADLEARLNLAHRDHRALPSSEGKTTVVFRVYRGSTTVPRALFIVGADTQLGALMPNTIAMTDNGEGGDQRAGDGVWSFTGAFAPGEAVAYVYTNSGAPGRWEGLDVPYVRRIEVPAAPDGRPVYLPIETFGRIYTQGDAWHTDAAGYDAIARAVARAVATLP